MEDYDKVLEATSVAENANGVAAEKMTVYNESLEAAQNRLTASVQQFAQDSNLDRTLALAYDGLSKVVEILNILLNKIPVLSPLIKALGVALAAAFIKSTIEKAKETGNVIDNLIKLLTGTQQQVKATTGLIPALSAAFTGLTGVINGTTTASAALGAVWTAMGGWVGVAITSIGALVALLPSAVRWFNDLKNAKENALKQSSQELDEANQNLEETNGQIKDIQDKINEINNKDSMTLTDQAEKERLEEELETLKQIKQVQEDIAASKKSETLQDTKDVVTEKYGGKDKSVDEYLSGLKQNTAGWENFTMSGSLDSINTASNSINELAANVKYLDEQKKELSATDSDYQEKLDAINQKEQENTQQLLSKKQELLEYKQQLIELGDTSSDEYQLVSKRINEITVALDPSNFPKLSVKDMIDTDGSEDKIKAAISKGGSSGFKELKGYADKFAQDILSDKITEAQWKEALGIPSTESLGVNELSTEILNIFQQMFNDISDSSSAATEGFKNQQEAIEAYRQAEDSLAQQTDILTVAYSEMNNQGHLNSSTVTALKKQYPELTDALITQNGQVVINTDTLKNLTNSIYDNEIASITAERNKTLETINQTRLRIAAYNAEITALEGLVKAGDETAEFDQNLAYQHREDAINQLNDSKKAVEEANAEIDKLNAQRAKGLQNNGISGVHKSSGKSGSSGKSAADKAAKEFEDSIKEKVQNAKSIVQLYSENANWDDPTVIKEFQDRYDKILNEVINDPKARKVLADAFNLDIKDMPVEQQIQELTTLWQKQSGTIQESYQKLLKNLAKEDLSSAKAVIEKYKDGIYGAWSSDEALNAAKADYQKFIDKITNDADYRAAMAEALNLGDISGEPVEKQIEAVTSALLKSTGTLDDAQQDLYDDASKNIKALQDEIGDMIDTAIDLLEKAGDFLFDMLGKISDRYDAQIDNLDKISDELDDQKDAFEDKIDQQKELLKLQKEEMDNADELAEKNKSIADIDAQLMELQYDNSAEAQAKRLKLLDERAQKEKDLADWQKDNDYNTKIDALDKEKSEYEKTIEAEKKAIEAQKQTLQDAQKQFETTLGNIQNGFNTFIKILSSDFVKDLISKALIGTGQDTVTQLLTGYNKLFGTGIDSDVTGIIKEGYKSLADIGSDTLNNVSNYNNRIVKSATKGIKSIISNTTNGVKSIFDSSNRFMKRLTSNGISSLNTIGTNGKGIISSLAGTANSLLSNLNRFASGIGQIATKGISGIFSGIGGMTSGVAGGMGGIGLAGAGLSSALPIAAIGAGVLSGALANVSTWYNNIKLWKDKDKSTGKKILGTIGNLILPFLPGGMLISAGKALSSLFKKHHTGADYVKKQNPMLDKMLGLGSDETVSILKVGEAIVPTWANGANSSGSSNRFTGSPFGSAVDSAVKTARVNTRTYSSSNSSSINISMPINIQGDADASTVNSLRKEADNIVNKVLKTINNQTRIGGYRNIKAATI